MRLAAVLVYTALQFTAVSAVAAYDKDLANAITAATQIITPDATPERLNKIEALLNNPPTGITKPLATSIDTAGFHYLFYFLMSDDTNPVRLERIGKMVEKAIRLGADPSQFVVFESENPYGLDSTAIEIILNEWEVNSKADDDQSRRFAAAGKKMFDIFFATRSAKLDFQLLIKTSPNEFGRVGFVHWLIRRQARPEIRDYFLRKGVGASSLDESGWNMAMLAAAVGDIATLKSVREICGSQTAMQMFNYRCPLGFNPTVLHAAVDSILHNVEASRVIEIIEFLVANGANPTQRSMFHDLVQEIDFWIPKYPEYAQEFRKVRTYLVANSGQLMDSYINCIRALK